jgi:hypothetical protein
MDQTEKENRATLEAEHQLKLEQLEQAHEQKLAELKVRESKGRNAMIY